MTSLNKIHSKDDDLAKFQHLLQPIRDITQNWQIDIAQELEDYLEELEQLQFSFDGGLTHVNFTQAALVIQGSACVYTKKVEHLYSIVFDVLNTMTHKKKKDDKRSRGALADVDDSIDVDEDGYYDFLKDESFLSLDLKECPKIDIEVEKPIDELDSITRDTSEYLKRNGDQNNEFLFDAKGDKIANISDFQMNTLLVHSSMALVDPSIAYRINESFRTRHQPNKSIVDTFILANETGMSIMSESALGDDVSHIALNAPDTNSQENNDARLEAPPLSDANIIDNKLIGEDMADFDDDGGSEVDCDFDNDSNEQQDQIPQDQVILAQDETPVFEWTPLDRHSTGKQQPKPFKKGKPFRTPAIVEKLDRGEAPLPKPQVPIGAFLESALKKKAKRPPSNPLKAPYAKQFNNLFRNENKRRQEIKKKYRQELEATNKAKKLKITTQELFSAFDNDNDFSADDGADDDDIDFDNDDQETVEVEGAMPTFSSDLAWKHGQNIENDSDPNVIQSYEELVKQHVRNCLMKARAYANETGLEKRVKKWEAKIKPLLEEENVRPSFDIHQYGDSIISSNIKENLEKKFQFQDLVQCQEQKQFEICRYFLATLQLACAGKINIDQMDKKTTGFEFQFTSDELHSSLQLEERPNASQKGVRANIPESEFELRPNQELKTSIDQNEHVQKLIKRNGKTKKQTTKKKGILKPTNSVV